VSAPVDTSWGTVPDVNGDGHADIVVGAYRSNRVHLYLGTERGLSDIPTTTLEAPAIGMFGASVASAGDVNGDGYADLVMSAYQANSGAGSAYLYLGGPSGVGKNPARPLVGSSATPERFGVRVASAGDVNGDGYADVLVVADGGEGMFGGGRAYLFLGNAQGLDCEPKRLAGNAKGFGKSIASAGDVNGDGYADVVAGEWKDPVSKGEDDSGKNGSVYLYLGSRQGLTIPDSPPLTNPEGTGTRQRYGYSVSGAGDVNGDGFSDVIVGTNPDLVDVSVDGLHAYVYLGSEKGLMRQPSCILPDPTGDPRSNFGSVVVGVGDVDGDGYSDAIVGASGVSVSTGMAYFYKGSVAGLSCAPVIPPISSPMGADSAFSGSISGVGDVDGDKLCDIAIGAPGTSMWRGKVYVYHGIRNGPISEVAAELSAPDENDLFGGAIAMRNVLRNWQSCFVTRSYSFTLRDI
jgi:hypothetical protein